MDNLCLFENVHHLQSTIMKCINFILFSLLLLSFSCDREELLLQDAENFEDIPLRTVSANIRGDVLLKSDFSISQLVQDRTFIVATGADSRLTIIIRNKDIAEYEFGGLNSENAIQYDTPSPDGTSRLFYSTMGKRANGLINLEAVNTQTNTISGSFEGLLVNTNDSSDTLRISNGFFNDIPYY